MTDGVTRDSRRGAVVAVVGAKGAPGATTSILALASGWPRPVLVVDADLAGGDVAPGWLAGRVGLDRGLLSFAAATRHADTATPTDLGPHVIAVPEAPGVMVLPGLAHAGQAGGLDPLLWARLVTAATSPWPTAESVAELVAELVDESVAGSSADSVNGPAARGHSGGSSSSRGSSGVGWAEAGERSARVDLLADCGRIGAGTPWPLLAAASVVLLATRPTLRGIHHARHALASLDAALPGILSDPGRVGLLVCGPGVYDAKEVARAVGLPVRLVLPADGRTADMLSDHAGDVGWRGARPGRPASGRSPLARTLLVRAARTAAHQLAAAAENSVDSAATGAEPPPLGPASDGTRWAASTPAAEGRSGTGRGGWR